MPMSYLTSEQGISGSSSYDYSTSVSPRLQGTEGRNTYKIINFSISKSLAKENLAPHHLIISEKRFNK